MKCRLNVQISRATTAYQSDSHSFSCLRCAALRAFCDSVLSAVLGVGGTLLGVCGGSLAGVRDGVSGGPRSLDPLGRRSSFRLIVIVGLYMLSTSLARGYWLQLRRLWGVWRICRRCGLCIDPWHRLTLQLRGGRRWRELCLNSWHDATSGWLGLSNLQEHKSFAQRNEEDLSYF